MLHLQLSDRDVERLFAGDQPQGRPDLAEVARFVARLRALGEVENPPPMNPKLLAELDLAEARRTSGHDEVGRRRERQRKRATAARRRWRLLGAVAMVAMLGGLVAATYGDLRSPATDSTDLTPAGDDVSTTSTDGATQQHEPSTGTKVPPTPPPTTAAPPAEAPADQPVAEGPTTDGHGEARPGGRDQAPPPFQWDDEWDYPCKDAPDPRQCWVELYQNWSNGFYEP